MVCQTANIARLQRETKNEQIATDRGKLIYEWGWGGGRKEEEGDEKPAFGFNIACDWLRGRRWFS